MLNKYMIYKTVAICSASIGDISSFKFMQGLQMNMCRFTYLQCPIFRFPHIKERIHMHIYVECLVWVYFSDREIHFFVEKY